MSTDSKMLIEESEEQLLLGIESDSISGSVALDRDADLEEIEETIEQLELEARHSIEILGREGSR
jgi:hypothetical protein